MSGMLGKVARVRARDPTARAAHTSRTRTPLRAGVPLPRPRALGSFFVPGGAHPATRAGRVNASAARPAHLGPLLSLSVRGVVPHDFQGVGGAVGGMARSVVFGDGERDGELDDGGAEVLLERIADGVLAADRRAAAVELRDLVQTSPQAQFAVGAIGLPTLVGSLREEREAPALMPGVLEALVAAIAAGAAPADANESAAPANGTATVGARVAEAFARNEGHLELVLSLLDDEDFYVRYHAVQLLAALASPCAHFLRGAVMSSPTGVGRLMDMMTEREVIRNETLLLLVCLTRQSEDLRKLVAFEGAFERCFNIAREEGAADGGVIVQDCLELCNNLLRGSPSNQTFFRESSFLTKIPDLIDGKTPAAVAGVAPSPVSAQKAANLLCALELVTLLASDGDAREIKSREKPDESVAAELEARARAAKAANRVANQAALVGGRARGVAGARARGPRREQRAGARERAAVPGRLGRGLTGKPGRLVLRGDARVAREQDVERRRRLRRRDRTGAGRGVARRHFQR